MNRMKSIVLSFAGVSVLFAVIWGKFSKCLQKTNNQEKWSNKASYMVHFGQAELMPFQCFLKHRYMILQLIKCNWFISGIDALNGFSENWIDALNSPEFGNLLHNVKKLWLNSFQLSGFKLKWGENWVNMNKIILK